MDEFDNDKTFEQEMFGWYKGIYISIKIKLIWKILIH